MFHWQLQNEYLLASFRVELMLLSMCCSTVEQYYPKVCHEITNSIIVDNAIYAVSHVLVLYDMFWLTWSV